MEKLSLTVRAHVFIGDARDELAPLWLVLVIVVRGVVVGVGAAALDGIGETLLRHATVRRLRIRRDSDAPPKRSRQTHTVGLWLQLGGGVLVPHHVGVHGVRAV